MLTHLAPALSLLLVTADAAPNAERIEFSLWPDGVRLGMTKEELMVARPEAKTTGMAMDDRPGPDDNDVASDFTDPGAAHMFFIVDGRVEMVAITSSPRAEKPAKVFDVAVRELGRPTRRIVLERTMPVSGGDEKVDRLPVLAWDHPDHPELSIRLRVDSTPARASLMVSTPRMSSIRQLRELPYDAERDEALFAAIDEALEAALAVPAAASDD